MNPTYFTPIKTLQESYQRKLFNSDSIHREGDWICLNCQNLNYSFRKKCNRCKTQSREENEAHSVYSYYYYPNTKVEEPLMFTLNCDANNTGEKSSTYEEKNFSLNKETVDFIVDSDSEENKENIHTNEFVDTILETPKKKKPCFESASKLDGLPSVSPLIKKYRLKEHHTTLEVSFFLYNEKQHKNLSTVLGLKESPTKQNYELPEVRVRDFDDLIHDFADSSPPKEYEDDEECYGLMKDIEDSIARIII